MHLSSVVRADPIEAEIDHTGLTNLLQRATIRRWTLDSMLSCPCGASWGAAAVMWWGSEAHRNPKHRQHVLSRSRN